MTPFNLKNVPKLTGSRLRTMNQLVPAKNEYANANDSVNKARHWWVDPSAAGLINLTPFRYGFKLKDA